MGMRARLVLCLLSVSFGLTALSLISVHRVLEKQIRERLVSDLQRSMRTYQDMESYRLHMLSRETALLADLPSLKALMTTEDQATIRDSGEEFFRIAGTDMLVLANSSGESVACYVRGERAQLGDCPSLARSSQGPYSDIGSRLYATAAKPIYFGSPGSGSLLGYVVTGYELDHALAEQIGQTAAAEVMFSAGGKVMASTLAGERRELAGAWSEARGMTSGGELAGAQDVRLGAEHYLAATLTLSGSARNPVRLVVLKSWDEASRSLRELDRLLAGIGVVVFALGCVLASWLSGTITGPLEELVAGTRALGGGDFRYRIQETGTKEIRELSTAFDQMRLRLLRTQQELIESERLATIGRMARSISHDLRHYLAAVYANAEFLGYDATRAEERAELLTEVKAGVQGMTDLIDSLLIFSRTGHALQISAESIPVVIERAVSMVRNHPDAAGVAIGWDAMELPEVWMDGRKVERALYNLVLNACQAARHERDPWVQVSLTEDEGWIRIFVTDNGPGVNESIRVTLFEPFVSDGKQSGVGIGLTLAHHISQEHGGSVTLVESHAGRTVFSMSLAKSRLAQFVEIAQESGRAAPVFEE